jgi:serine/threonine protein kinase
MDFKNRYRFDPQKDLIGRGGFARVFKATDVLLDRVVAIKFYTNTGDNSYTLIKEIGRAIKLEHPNLCRYYDATVLESVSVLGEKETIEVGVMEYLDAGDIAAYLKKHPGYRDRMLMDVLLGLQYLHRKDIIHRDIKPNNILVKETDEGPVAKICDFGISKTSMSSTTRSSNLMGTISYMAPEQFNPQRYGVNGKISTNLDLWSWACLSYELITGDSLFASRQLGSSTEQIMSNILHDNYEEKIALLPPPYNDALRICLLKNANERAQEAGEVLKVLRSETPVSASTAVTDNEKTRVIPKEVPQEKKPLISKQEPKIEPAPEYKRVEE